MFFFIHLQFVLSHVFVCALYFLFSTVAAAAVAAAAVTVAFDDAILFFDSLLFSFLFFSHVRLLCSMF